MLKELFGTTTFALASAYPKIVNKVISGMRNNANAFVKTPMNAHQALNGINKDANAVVLQLTLMIVA